MLSARGARCPGIVVRDAAGRVARIVEATDATPEELAIEERNTGVYLVDAELLWKALAQVDDQNRQGEIYLTDIVERRRARGPPRRGAADSTTPTRRSASTRAPSSPRRRRCCAAAS